MADMLTKHRFTNGDQIASLVKVNGQLLRGHNLVWYQQLPSWGNSVPTAQVGSALTTHVTTVVNGGQRDFAAAVPLRQFSGSQRQLNFAALVELVSVSCFSLQTL
ncbi:hypothetical protein B0H13DRAFT_1925905 [Mycena leptocephala]|nr:hypothetical protein B0H13DRAFT_1925905 [Mycena leptocephala]